MTINAATKSVRDIFSDYELEIPRYQRKYDWKQDDAAELWNTIIESYDEKTSKPDGPFLGNIILQKDVTGKFAVIDGQQRLTTLTILLIALLKFTAQKKETLHNKNNSEFEIMVSINNQCTRLLYDNTANGGLKMHFHASDDIRDMFENMVRNSWEGFKTKEPKITVTKRSWSKDKEKRRKLVKDLFNYYTDELEKLTISNNGIDAERLFAIIQQINVVLVTIDGDEDAYSLFERTNNLGVPLSIGDILKNRLFKELQKKEDKDLITMWDEDIVEPAGNQFSKILRQFYMSRNGHVSNKQLINKLLEYFNSKIEEEKKKEIKDSKDCAMNAALNFICELNEYEDFYTAYYCNHDVKVGYTSDKENPEAAIFKIDLNDIKQEEIKMRLGHVQESLRALQVSTNIQFIPLLFSIHYYYQKKEIYNDLDAVKKLEKIYLSVENFHFINTIVCNRRANEVEHMYPDFASKIYKLSNDKEEDGSQFNKVIEELSDFYNKNLSIIEDFKIGIKDIEYKTKLQTLRLIQYIFWRYDCFIKAKINKKDGVKREGEIYDFQSYKNVKSYILTVEHIFPQKPKNTVVPDNINSLGNLISLEARANMKLGNSMPWEKYEHFKNKIGRPHIEDFLKENEEEQLKSWGKEQIDKRTDALADTLYKNIFRIYI
jgi:uncharacterized protein with ParB-like and HNH nuclease domain